MTLDSGGTFTSPRRPFLEFALQTAALSIRISLHGLTLHATSPAAQDGSSFAFILLFVSNCFVRFLLLLKSSCNS